MIGAAAAANDGVQAQDFAAKRQVDNGRHCAEGRVSSRRSRRPGTTNSVGM